jgi:amino acid transporter
VAGNMTITLAVIGPAASVFAIGSVALRQQGSGAFLAFLIAALISGCLAVGWAELGALYPTAGGLYGIVARVLGRRAGFLALTLQLALFVIVPSAFALAAGQYLNAVWPTISPRTAALVLLAIATTLAVVGIRFNAAVTAALLTLELAIILVVSALGVAHAHWSLAGTLLDPRLYAADRPSAYATWAVADAITKGSARHGGLTITAGSSITPTTRPATAIAATRSSSAWSTRFQLACTTAATSTSAATKTAAAESAFG